MKRYFVVSLIKNGLLGGGIIADERSLTYHTGKVTVPLAYRHFVMKYSEMEKVTADRFLLMPSVTVTMKNGETYRFAVFFGRTRLMDLLRAGGVDA